MAVLCEGISVIVRRDAIDERFQGGWPAFQDLVPNATLCTDGELARVGFMDPGSVEAFVDALEERGLTFWTDPVEAPEEDIAVVDQLRGPTRVCDWLEFSRFPMGKNPDDRVSICWLFAGKRIDMPGVHLTGSSMALYTPQDWVYEGSLSQQFTFVTDDDMEERLEFLRLEDGVAIYRDRNTGKEVYVGHPDVKGAAPSPRQIN